MVRSFGVGLLVALTAVSALLLATLLLVNWWHRRRDSRAERLRNALQAMLAGWAERDPAPAELEWLERLPRGDARTVLVASLEALSGVEAGTAARAREALRRSGLAACEVARLHDRSAARRVEACRFAGRLGDPGAVPTLVERLRDPDLEVRREAIRALGELRACGAVADIAEAIEGMGEWSNLLLVMALIRMGPGTAPAVGALLAASRSPGMTKALLQVTGRLGLSVDPGTIRALASHPYP